MGMNFRQRNVSQPLKRTRAQIQWCDLPWHSKLTDTDKDHRIFTKQFVKAKVKPREANIAIRSMRKLLWKPTVSKPKPVSKSKPKKVRAMEKKDKKDKQKYGRKQKDQPRKKGHTWHKRFERK